MSRLDVLMSFLRSGARSAQLGLRDSNLGKGLRRVVAEVGFRRASIDDAALTRAVTRVPGVAAATVSSAPGRLRIDASFDDGERFGLALSASGSMFAPGGAKELSFGVEPAALAFDPRSSDVCGAIASEIARNLWKPALMRAPRSESAASVTHHAGTLIVDLRSVPEVRWALRQTLPALLIEAIRLRSLAIDQGRIVLELSLDRFG